MSKIFELIKGYWLIIFLIFSSGSIFGISLYYIESVILLFVLSGVVFVKEKLQNPTVNRNRIVSVFILVVSILLIITLNAPEEISSYFAIVLQVSIAFFITESCRISEMSIKFVNVIKWLAAISLVGFLLYLIFPNIALLLPKTEGYSSLEYYNAIVYIFPARAGFGYFVPFYRNIGIFWEPGAYQAFLNIAIIFALNRKDFLENRKNVIWLLIMMICIITTFSTTGYIVLAITLIIYNKRIRLLIHISRNMKWIATAVLVFAMLLVFTETSAFDFLIVKWGREFFVTQNFIDRLYLEDISILAEKPLNFFGITFENFYSMGGGSANSIVHTLVSLGVPFTATILYSTFKFCFKLKYPLICFVIITIILSTESFFWRPFFLCLSFYGLDNYKFNCDTSAIDNRR